MIDDFQRPPQNMRARLEANRVVGNHPGFGQVTPSDTPLSEPAKIELLSPDFRPVQSSGPQLPTPVEPAFGPADHLLQAHADGGHPDNTDNQGLPLQTLQPPEPSKAFKTPARTVMLFGKWPVSRKKLIIFIVAIVMLLAAGAYYTLVIDAEEPPVVTKAATKQAAPPPPPPIVSPLTGVTVDSKDKTSWPVIGVMIENSPDSRPQSGLKQAGIVFEAIAEAGITRFLALYQEDRPGNIGPIRSSRPYYLDWAMAFDASYAHVGGSPDALARIKSINTKDLDQFYNPSGYHRITSRYAPHNVYTGVQQLVDLSTSKGWTGSQFTPLSRKADQPFKAAPATGNTNPSDGRTPANSVDLAISGAYYNAHYDYDAATNTYKRSMAGTPHMDADTNTQIQPKTVVALAMPYSLMADGYHSQYATIGSGKMFVFQDGVVTTGTWSKGEPSTQFDFKDDAGKTLKLNSGQTWLSVVGDAAKVVYR